MTYRPRRSCKRCGVDRAAAGGLSHSGLCGPCGEEKLAEALKQISEKSGPIFAKYRDGITDYAARLWGDSVPPHPPDTALTFDDLLEDPAWLDGQSPRQETRKTPPPTSRSLSDSRSC